MPTSLSTEHLHQLALLGAYARMNELKAEVDAIRRAFPDLSGRRGRPAATANSAEGAGPTPRRRRRTMSAAQRKAVSERMTKYWAARRAGRKK